MNNRYKLEGLESVYYIPDYISEAEEQALLASLDSSAKWTQVSGRRLQCLGGTVHEKKGVLLQTHLPGWLAPLAARVAADTQAFGPGAAANHVLVNAYRRGEGILPHEDGPLYHPGVCIVSLNGPAVMRFRPKRGSADGCATTGIALGPRSLLIFSSDAYTKYLHGIDEVDTDTLDASILNRHVPGALPPRALELAALPRSPLRISLTIRRVLRVQKNLLRLSAHAGKHQQLIDSPNTYGHMQG